LKLKILQKQSDLALLDDFGLMSYLNLVVRLAGEKNGVEAILLGFFLVFLLFLDLNHHA
jgi:hypothetical protein